MSTVFFKKNLGVMSGCLSLRQPQLCRVAPASIISIPQWDEKQTQLSSVLASHLGLPSLVARFFTNGLSASQGVSGFVFGLATVGKPHPLTINYTQLGGLASVQH